MKKRMFLSTILMTLVLLLAVTTATFAWYTVGAAADAQGVEDTDTSITTAANNYSAGGVTFTAVLGTPSKSAVQLSDDNGQTFYYLADGTTKVEDKSSTLDSKYGLITVSIEAALKAGTSPDVSLTDLLTSLAGKRVTVTISGTAGMKFKKADSITAHNTELYRAVDNGWKNETVSYYVDITAGNAATLASTFLAAQTFAYGFDGTVITSAAGSYTITATVEISATPQ